jgi:peptidoglycan/xylan/chitin deacetylase (PgdA/CDA1 family)
MLVVVSSRGKSTGSVLALSFDDGPSPWTIEILDLLAEHGARATFFILGANIAAQESTLCRALAEGHELGLHTWSHPHLPAISPEQIRDEMLRTQEAIERATGTVARLWRPPYLEADARVRGALVESGLIEASCTIAPEDYHWPAQRTAAFVLERLEPGVIVDLHDGRREGSGSDPTRSETVRALALILAEIDRAGLASVPVTELPPAALENLEKVDPN